MKSIAAELICSRPGKKLLELSAALFDSKICTAASVRRQAESYRAGRKAGLRFSVGIPHYNRGATICRPLFNLLRHPAVTEIVIVDDGSSPDEFELLSRNVREMDSRGRVKIHRREHNLGALRTKLECAEMASSDWVLILDSDNTAFMNYLNALAGLGSPGVDAFYCAGWAFPHFPFHPLQGMRLDFQKACALTAAGDLRRYYIINDGNYLVHRDSYIRSVKALGTIASDVADVMVVNYHWLSQGGCLQILPGTSYFHRVDASSFWCRTEEESRRRVSEIFARFEARNRWDEEFHRSLSLRSEYQQ
jgi:glycosyltransferase involved in cell wall biosynthesis